MARRRYLVTYDVADDKRRNAIFKALEGYGDHTQYSVFLCELDRRELAEMQGELDPHVHGREDQVLIVDLGPEHVDAGRLIASLGRPYEPPTRALVV